MDLRFNEAFTDPATESFACASSPTPITRKFSCEQALVQKFTQITYTAAPRIDGIAVEVDSGNGIADIILYKARKDLSKHMSIIQVKPAWAYSLVVLPYRKQFDASLLAQLCCVTERTAEKILNAFKMAGFCEKVGSNWFKHTQPRAPLTRLYAIEAKIKDWKRALYQATRYAEFADQSWVLLDNHYRIPAINQLAEFSKRNIGLLTLSNNGDVEIRFTPSEKSPHSNYRRWYTMIKMLRNQYYFKNSL